MSGQGYVGTTKRFQLAGLTFDDVAVTTIGVGEQITVELVQPDGTVWATLDTTCGVTHEGSGTWSVLIDLPTEATTLHVHWLVVKGGAVEKFHDKISVKPFV